MMSFFVKFLMTDPRKPTSRILRYQTALITDGGRGIGRTIAQILAAARQAAELKKE